MRKILFTHNSFWRLAAAALTAFTLLINMMTVFPVTAYADSSQDPASVNNGNVINILMIGNSLTYSPTVNKTAPTIMRGLAQAAGENIDLTVCSYDGENWGSFADPEKNPGKALRSCLAAKTFDYVIMQQNSNYLISGKDASVRDGLAVAELISQNSPDAKLFINSTWAFMNDDYSEYDNKFYTYSQMRTNINATSAAVAGAINKAGILSCDVIYSGDMFHKVWKESGINPYKSDENHPSDSGVLINAYAIYSKILKKDPVNVQYNGDVSAADANTIRNAVSWQFHNGFLRDFSDMDGNWYYCKDGIVGYDITSVVKNINGWFAVINGKVDFSFTGFMNNEYGRWRIENGVVNFDFKGTVKDEGEYRYYEGGKWQSDVIVDPDQMGDYDKLPSDPANGGYTIELDVQQAEMSTLQTFKIGIETNVPVEEIEWSSSDPNIASVDQNGVVTANRYGNAVITASAEERNGASGSCMIQTRYYDVAEPAYSRDSAVFKSVYWAADRGITQGYGNVYFDPDAQCSRLHFALFLWRMAGRPASQTTTLNFTDSKENGFPTDTTSDSFKAVAWAVENGIIRGYSDGEFKAARPVTRMETMIMIYRFAGSPEVEGEITFSDVKAMNLDTQSAKYRSILWGSSAGITKGYSDGTFKPNDNVKRKEMIIMLYRYDSSVN